MVNAKPANSVFESILNFMSHQSLDWKWLISSNAPAVQLY